VAVERGYGLTTAPGRPWVRSRPADGALSGAWTSPRTVPDRLIGANRASEARRSAIGLHRPRFGGTPARRKRLGGALRIRWRGPSRSFPSHQPDAGEGEGQDA